MLLLISLLSSLALANPLGPWLDEDPGESDTAVEPLADEVPPPCSTTLQNGVQIPDRPELFVRWDPARAWGTSYFVDTLVKAAETMASERPETDPIVIGDISTRRGGHLPPHITHNSGIDADIGFYMYDGKQPGVNGFQKASPTTLDMETTWLLVSTLLESGRVQYILLDQWLIDAMRKWTVTNGRLTASEAERIFLRSGAPSPGIPGYLRHAPNHRDHLHVHARCTPPTAG